MSNNQRKKAPINKSTQSTSSKNTSNKVANFKEKQNKNTSKKLTMSNINRLASKFNEKRKIYITVDGEEFEVLVNTTFGKSEVEDACLEFLEVFAKTVQQEGIDVKALMKNIERFMQVYILKTFTNLPIPNDIDNISKLLKLTNNLYNLGILEQFFVKNAELFGQDNLNLVNKTFNKIAESVGKLTSDKVLLSELIKASENAIDVDDYFATLELRNFEIAEDEDLSLLPKVIDQLNEEGKYSEYMSKLTTEELDKLNERLRLLKERESVVNGDKSEEPEGTGEGAE